MKSKSFAGWMYTIAVNLQKDKASKARPDSIMQDDVRCEGETPESRLLQKELRSELDRLLEVLPEHYRLVFILRYTNQLNHAEIAEITGMSVRQVTNVLFRAKISLRKIVEDKGDSVMAFWERIETKKKLKKACRRCKTKS